MVQVEGQIRGLNFDQKKSLQFFSWKKNVFQVSRIGHELVRFNGIIYAIGGLVDKNNPNKPYPVEYYDIKADEWKNAGLASPNTRDRFYFDAFVL